MFNKIVIDRYRSAVASISLIMVMICLVTMFVVLHVGLYQGGGNGFKYDISAEIYNRILFCGDLAKLDQDLGGMYGRHIHVLQGGFATATTDERPLYFFYLALMKLAEYSPVMLHFVLNLALLFSSIFFLSRGMIGSQATSLAGTSNAFIFLGLLLLPPFAVNQAFVYEPHVPETFLTCLAFFLMARGWVVFAFAVAFLSIGFHPGNLPLVGGLGLYHLSRDRNWRTIHGWLWPFMGCAIGIAFIWGFEIWLFSKDTAGILLHEHLIERLLFSSERTAGSIASAPNLSNFVRNLFVFMPLGVAGIFWIKGRRELLLVLLPLLIYLLFTKGHMPGAHRVLLPVFFLSQAFFLHNFLNLQAGIARLACRGIIVFSVLSSLSYYVITTRCFDLRFAEGVVAVDPAVDNYSLGPEPARLRWNLKRFNRIDEASDVVVSLREVGLLEQPKVSEPYTIYPYLIAQMLHTIFPEEIARRMGATPGKAQGFGPVVIRRKHVAR